MLQIGNTVRYRDKSEIFIWVICQVVSGIGDIGNFWKIKLETIHFGAYLKQLFEITNKMVQLPTFMKNH